MKELNRFIKSDIVRNTYLKGPYEVKTSIPKSIYNKRMEGPKTENNIVYVK